MLKIKRIFFFTLIVFCLLGPLPESVKSSSQINVKNNYFMNSKSVGEQVWPFEKYNVQRTGEASYDASQNKGGEKWKYFSDSDLSDTAVIGSDGVLYVSTHRGDLHAVYPNGTRKWSFETNLELCHAAPGLAPDGTIYFGTFMHLYAIDSNGSEKWVFNKSGLISCEPIVDSNGTIYVAIVNQVSGCAVYAINANGTEKWEFPFSYPNIVQSLTLDKEGNIYFVPVWYSGQLFCLRPDGSLKWMKNMDSEFSPVIAVDGTIYVWTTSHVYALTPDGQEKWSIENFGWQGEISLAPDGTIILCGGSYFITALSPLNGSVLWQYQIGERPFIDIVSSAAISGDGTIFFAYTAYSNCVSYLCALTNDGRLKWETLLTTQIQPYDEEYVFSSPSIDTDGTVYITSNFIRGGTNYTSIGYIHAIGMDNPVAPEPPTIDGPRRVILFMKNEYTLCSNVSDGGNVSYFIFWDDVPYATTEPDNWIGPYSSGEPVEITHRFKIPGRHFVQVKAVGDDSLCSQWSVLEVRTPFWWLIEFFKWWWEPQKWAF